MTINTYMITEENIRQAINTHQSMAAAARQLNIPFGTFKYRAQQLGVYVPNQSHIGRSLPNKGNSKRVPIKDILDGNYSYKGSGSVLKKRLISEGIKEDKCEECGQLPSWNGKYLVLQLDHKDGNNENWTLNNLRILCPNCHTQTPTHSGKARKYTKYRSIRDLNNEDILQAAASTNSITELARLLNLNPKNELVRYKLKMITSPSGGTR